jgi:hypothetical protein
MLLGSTHRGRVLRGTIVSDGPVVMVSAMFHVQDEQGDTTMVNGGIISPRSCLIKLALSYSTSIYLIAS